MMKKVIVLLGIVMLLCHSCATKKDIHYLLDADIDVKKQVELSVPTIQPNDILSVKINAQSLEAAQPYNLTPLAGSTMNQNAESLKLQGYLVSKDYTVNLPNIGEVSVKGLSVNALEDKLTKQLVDNGELTSPTVNVRILNSKVTVIGEVKTPGTFSYTEQAITLPQALGYAGDLTINGERKDVTIIREIDGEQVIAHLDLTSSDWLNSPYYYIKQNDVIYVKQNTAKVKSSGIVGNAGTVLTLASVILSAIVIITR